MSVETAAFGSKKSAKQVLIDAIQHSDDAQGLIIVMKDKDGYINSSWSDGSGLERIGLLQVAIARQIANMMDDS